jgi:hypothetical protein
VPQPGSAYLDTYRDGGVYNELEYGSPYVSKGVKFARHECRSLEKGSKVLCIGCGCGWEVVEYLLNGHDAFGTEVHSIDIPILSGRIINAAVPNLPFKDNEFDLLHCTEVLEHVPELETDAFLKECKRVAKRHLFSIADIPDDWNTHINLHGASWWIKRFEKAGFYIKHFEWKPVTEVIVGNVFATSSYKHGYKVICN